MKRVVMIVGCLIGLVGCGTETPSPKTAEEQVKAGCKKEEENPAKPSFKPDEDLIEQIELSNAFATKLPDHSVQVTGLWRPTRGGSFQIESNGNILTKSAPAKETLFHCLSGWWRLSYNIEADRVYGPWVRVCPSQAISSMTCTYIDIK